VTLTQIWIYVFPGTIEQGYFKC